MPPSSPCVNLCVLDGPTGLCRGCGRTLDEIGRWAELSERERLAIMGDLSVRLAAVREAVGTDRGAAVTARTAGWWA